MLATAGLPNSICCQLRIVLLDTWDTEEDYVSIRFDIHAQVMLDIPGGRDIRVILHYIPQLAILQKTQ